MIVIRRGMSAALLVVFAIGTAACGSSAKKTTPATSTTASVSTNADSLHHADVVVTAAGLLDDSVRASRFDLHLARQSDQSWRLTRAR